MLGVVALSCSWVFVRASWSVSAKAAAASAEAAGASFSGSLRRDYTIHRRHGVGTLGGRLTTFQILLWAPAVS